MRKSNKPIPQVEQLLNETKEDKTPHGLRPYIFHGVDLEIKDSHGIGNCPFCNNEGKFSVDIETSQWKCWTCGGGQESGGGNALIFLREYYKLCYEKTDEDFYELVALDRRLLNTITPQKWGVVQSCLLPNTWLIAGYGCDGKLNQVYKRTYLEEKYLLLPTPGVWPEGKVHHLHFSQEDYDNTRARPNIVICEGPWDGMALSEVLDDELGNCDLIAVPGCNVWRDEWTALCKGRDVTILFDSDHPRTQGIRTYIAGYDGVVRIAKRLSGVARSVSWLRWGKDGWHKDKPNGWDIRDALSGMPDEPLEREDRKSILFGLIRMIEPASLDWFSSTTQVHTSNGKEEVYIEARPCHTWKECLEAWDNSKGGALQLRQDLEDTIITTLAVCASTKQSGNQLFVDVVASPGSAKTTIVRGALASRHCVNVENLTKIVSGYKMADDGDKDCSFIARHNNKTWITCEFDTVLASPQYVELMGKIRRIFDGEISSTYGNTDKDRHYKDLRTPWIRAGTWKMMTQDQSQLGDRFLRIIINDPTEQEKKDIVMSAIECELNAMIEMSNGTPGGIVDPKTRKAHGLMGGYVDWLRANIEDKVLEVHSNINQQIKTVFRDLAEFSADMRARPSIPDKWKQQAFDLEGHKELPTRLGRQFTRLALDIAVVLNKKKIDKQVLRVVRKVAMDTSYGHTLNVANWMCSINPKTDSMTFQECGGIKEDVLQSWCRMNDEHIKKYISFLRKIDVLRVNRDGNKVTYMLTDRLYNLYLGLRGELLDE